MRNVSEGHSPNSPEDLVPILTPEAAADIKALALRQHKANGLLMQLVTFVGGQVEDGMRILPAKHRARLEEVAARGLRASYDAAGRSQTGLGRLVAGDRAHQALAAVSGAVGGLGGLPTALVELPVATTVIFRAVQNVAKDYGEDPRDEKTRAQCLLVFGQGGPGAADDGIDTSFIGARLGLSGAAINSLISNIAPRFATVLGQKLGTQAVPVLGAAAGAGTNFTFIKYYTDVAHVHFGLNKLAKTYGEEAVSAAYAKALAGLRSPLLKAAGP